MEKVKFFTPAKEYLRRKDEIDAAMQDVLSRGDLILRIDVEEFEEKFAEYVGTKYAVGVASGTDALILALKALGIRPADHVSAPSYTFRATVEAIHHVGAMPDLYDLGDVPDINRWTKAWVPAHIAGEVSTSDELYNHLKEKGIVIVEDFAQAIGAAPVRGHAACYSFYPAKILGCYGDGGAIATNDKALYEKLKIMRNHFKGDWGPVGYNSRLDNLQAAVLNVKIKYLPQDIARRKAIARMYDAELTTKVKIPTIREVYQDYIIECENEFVCMQLHRYLDEQGIETLRNGYPFPNAYPKGPKTAQYEEQSLRLPCNPELTDEEVERVIQAVNTFYAV